VLPWTKTVIPAKAGIQTLRAMPIPLGFGFRRDDKKEFNAIPGHFRTDITRA